MKARTALAALLAAAALGLAWRVRGELDDYRRRAARLRSDWRSIAGIAGPAPLRLHAQVREDAGTDRAPVVLVHGYGIGSSYFVPLAERLAGHVRVYAPDLPGHGRSDHDARPLGIAELGAALAAWMGARGLRGAVVVAHSHGCQVVLEALARDPGLACELVLIGPTLAPQARGVARLLARALIGTLFERPSAGVWMALDYYRAGARVLAAELRAMLAHAPEPLLAQVRVPVRVVRGSRDLVAPQRWAERVARLTGAPAPAVIRGWGHAVHYDAPATVAGLILG